MLATLICASAQQSIDLGEHSGLETDAESPLYIFFGDTTHGWLMTSSRNSLIRRYQTTDGGASWQTASAFHVPFKVVSGGLAISSNDGFISYDKGRTWQQPIPRFNDPMLDNSSVLGVTAASPRQIAVRLWSGVTYYDSSTGEAGSTSFERLAYTLDGGQTWSIGDSLVARKSDSEWVPSVYHRTPFGELPSPQEMVSPQFGWVRLEAMPDSSTLLVVTFAKGMVDGKSTVRYYLGRLNLRTKSAKWSALPMWVDLQPYDIDASLSEMQMPTPGVFYARDFEFRTYTSNDIYTYYKGFWRSEDSGHTWVNYLAPNWLDPMQIRFLSATHGVSTNGITNDGGQSWQPLGSPYQDWPPYGPWVQEFSSTDYNQRFYAVDSTHYFFANAYSLFARSTDAGKTWERNGTGSRPLAIAAHHGRVLVGRNYRSLFLSDDAGTTWRDVFQEEGLPAGLSSVWSLAFPDTGADPDHIIGIGGFISDTAERYAAVIESTDGGLHWSKGEQLPVDYLPIYPSTRLFFANTGSRSRGFLVAKLDSVGASQTNPYLLTSDDRGRSWARRDTFPYSQFTMTDADNGFAVAYDKTLKEYHLKSTTDGGISWQGSTVVPEGQLHAFSDGELRIVGFVYAGSSRTAFVYRSTDKGHTWDTVHRTTIDPPKAGTVVWLDTAHLYIFSGNVWYSTSGGDFYLPINFVGGALLGWDDMYFYSIGIIDQPNKGGRLRIGTRSSSVPLAGSSEKIPATILANPSRDKALVRYNIEHVSDVQVNLYDLLGQVVRSISEHCDAGAYELRLDLRGLPAGHYTLRIASASASTSLPLVVLP